MSLPEPSTLFKPEEVRFNFEILPSKIPPGLSTYSTSTAVMVNFANHQCLATATATGICRQRQTTTTIKPTTF